MRIILVAVISANGKITKGISKNIYEWSSKEDKDHFSRLRNQNNLIVMGSATYNAIKTFIPLSPSKLRIVMTRHPNKYKHETVPGQLEFTSETPKQLIKRCMIDHTSMMLVGGSEINALFLQENLVDEILLTIEPYLFGKGIPLVADSNFESKLQLISINKLNTKGTLLLKYRVLR